MDKTNTDYITANELKKKYDSMFTIPFVVFARGCGKTIMRTQRIMGTLYSKEFIKRINNGEKLTETDYLEGLKQVYSDIGKMFYGDE